MEKTKKNYCFFKQSKYLIALAFVLCAGMTQTYAQESVNASGGDASGSDGSVAYSIGQVFVNSVSGNNGIIAQGIQQAYGFFQVGVDDLEEAKGINLYPNPVGNTLYVEMDMMKPGLWVAQVFNMEGKEIMSTFLASSLSNLSANQMAAGNYILRIQKNNKNVKSYKIIKQ